MTVPGNARQLVTLEYTLHNNTMPKLYKILDQTARGQIGHMVFNTKATKEVNSIAY